MQVLIVKNINGMPVPDRQNIQMQQYSEHENDSVCDSVAVFDQNNENHAKIHCCNTYASFTEKKKYLHISGSLLFFVLLLRLISNLLISAERSLGEKTETLY